MTTQQHSDQREEACAIPEYHEQRWLHFEGLSNSRDLGGMPLADGGTTAWGVVARGESPQFLTTTGVAQLLEYGVRTVVDLRTGIERGNEGCGNLCHDKVHGLHRVHAPLVSDAAWASDPVGRDNELDKTDAYRSWLNGEGAGGLVEMLERIAAGVGGVYVHCAVGKDRTGVVTALLSELAGVRDDAVCQDYMLTDHRLDRVLAKLKGSKTYTRDLREPNRTAQAPRPADMGRLLAMLRDEHDGAQGWFRSRGASPRVVDAARKRLRGE